MAWGGFLDKDASKYALTINKIERTIKNLEELSQLLPSSKHGIIQAAIDALADIPELLREDSKL